MSDNRVKIPAAYLIEKCGLKGIKKGNVGTFKKARINNCKLWKRKW